MSSDIQKPDRYGISDEFVRGFGASMLTEGRDQRQSVHWLAGWDAGYGYRWKRNEEMNRYLESIGLEHMATIRLC